MRIPGCKCLRSIKYPFVTVYSRAIKSYVTVTKNPPVATNASIKLYNHAKPPHHPFNSGIIVPQPPASAAPVSPLLLQACLSSCYLGPATGLSLVTRSYPRRRRPPETEGATRRLCSPKFLLELIIILLVIPALLPVHLGGLSPLGPVCNADELV